MSEALTYTEDTSFSCIPKTSSKNKCSRKVFHGYSYQINVAMFCIIRAHKRYVSYEIDLEKEKCGKFDDIVIKFIVDDHERYIFSQTKHVRDEKIRENKITGVEILKGEKFGLKSYLPSFIKIKCLYGIDKIESLVFSTNQPFNFTDDPKLSENIKKLVAKNSGNIYLQKVNEYFLSSDKSECYQFVTMDGHPDLYNETMQTIEENLGIFDLDDDKNMLINELIEFAYVSNRSKNCRFLNFYENSKLSKYKYFLIEKIFDTANVLIDGGNEILFSKSFLGSEENYLKLFRQCLEKKLFKLYASEVNLKNIIFYIDNGFDNNELIYDVREFMKKIRYAVNHLPLKQYNDVLENEIKTVDSRFNLCDTSFIIKSFKSDVVEKLSVRTRQSYTRERFKKFLDDMYATICCLNVHGCSSSLKRQIIGGFKEKSFRWIQDAIKFIESDKKILNFVTNDNFREDCYSLIRTIEQLDDLNGKGSYILQKSSTFDLLKREIKEVLQKEEVKLLVLIHESDEIDLRKIIDLWTKKIIIISKEYVTDTHNIKVDKILFDEQDLDDECKLKKYMERLKL